MDNKQLNQKQLERHQLGEAHKPATAGQRGGLWGMGGGGLVVGLTLAVLIGLQLGAMPWRFRRQMFQLQGALAGGLVGFVVGWGVGRSRRPPGGGEPRRL
ncbi:MULTISPECIES: hypothetical protein [unclassified Synechococcus]|uniref:hypothetical protein n=1 Tax=unclassified Synechococcus TaxID=2626047 RepID=UPI0000698F91|nr:MULTISPECIES: hypothetical protein [unclassified Synechococcus]EAQ74076.1 hypothetical protein WH5701_12218 [Synechococcus sp. WH 5701]WFN58351.1 hypothetical protein N4320_11095 [Synechococcus sp. CCFWC 502]